jgi:hypothetical protein
MTRLEQKKEERRTLNKLLSFLGITPEKIDDKDPNHPPDFMLQIAGRTIGVEVTTYRSDETVAADSKKHKRSRRETFSTLSQDFPREAGRFSRYLYSVTFQEFCSDEVRTSAIFCSNS